MRLPREDFVYLGDTARFPYGERSPEEIERFAAEIAEELLRRRAKLLVVACNSAPPRRCPSLRARMLETTLGVDVLGVVRPEAMRAVAATRSGRIGLLATPTTVASGAYEQAVATVDPHVTLHAVACPTLAAIIQAGEQFDEQAVATVREACEPLRERGRGHGDPRLHPLSADQPAAAADARPGGDARQLRRGAGASGRARAEHARARRTRARRARATTASCAPATWRRSARWRRASCRCRWARSSTCSWPRSRCSRERAQLRARAGRAAPDDDRAGLHAHRDGLGADLGRRDARDLHRLGPGERAALDGRPGHGLGDGRVRDAARRRPASASSATRPGGARTGARSRSSA